MVQKRSNSSEEKLNSKIRYISRLLTFLVVLSVVNIGAVGWLGFSSGQNITNDLPEKIISAPGIQKPENREPNQKTITQFTNNKGIVDVGWILKLEKNSIATNGSPNCKPSADVLVQNGCYFALLPYSLGISTRGTIFKSILVDGKLTKNASVFVDLKNYGDDDKFEQVSELTSDKLNKEIPLPQIIPSNKGLYFRLFSKDGEIDIMKIRLSYYSTESLKPVTIKMNPEQKNLFQGGFIAADTNGNGDFEPNIDQRWGCKPNFPGVKTVEINDLGIAILTRDDTCFVDVKPQNWAGSDGAKRSLPAGGWFLISPDNSQKIYFEVDHNVENQDITVT
jgi:hypothetical protein